MPVVEITIESSLIELVANIIASSLSKTLLFITGLKSNFLNMPFRAIKATGADISLALAIA